MESLRREHQPVEPLRVVGDGVCNVERRFGGTGGAAGVGPVGRTQVGSILQLIYPSGFRAPTQTQPVAFRVTAWNSGTMVIRKTGPKPFVSPWEVVP